MLLAGTTNECIQSSSCFMSCHFYPLHFQIKQLSECTEILFHVQFTKYQLELCGTLGLLRPCILRTQLGLKSLNTTRCFRRNWMRIMQLRTVSQGCMWYNRKAIDSSAPYATYFRHCVSQCPCLYASLQVPESHKTYAELIGYINRHATPKTVHAP